jgi:hypothetical protein
VKSGNAVERTGTRASQASELAFTGNDPWPTISLALVLLGLGAAAAVVGAKLRTRP